MLRIVQGGWPAIAWRYLTAFVAYFPKKYCPGETALSVGKTEIGSHKPPPIDLGLGVPTFGLCRSTKSPQISDKLENLKHPINIILIYRH